MIFLKKYLLSQLALEITIMSVSTPYYYSVT